MVLDRITEILNNSGKIEFKLYGVNYTIELNEGSFYVYQSLNSLRQNKYLSLNELFKSYTVYNETLENNINAIEIIE